MGEEGNEDGSHSESDSDSEHHYPIPSSCCVKGPWRPNAISDVFFPLVSCRLLRKAHSSPTVNANDTSVFPLLIGESRTPAFHNVKKLGI